MLKSIIASPEMRQYRRKGTSLYAVVSPFLAVLLCLALAYIQLEW